MIVAQTLATKLMSGETKTVMILRSYKYRLYPNPEQAAMIDKTIGVCRLVYNLALEVKIRAYQEFGVRLSAYDIQREIKDLRKEYDWIAEVNSQAIGQSVNHVDVAFKKFFKGSGYPNFKKRKHGGSFQCHNGLRKIDWEKSILSIPKIYNIPITLSRRFEGKVKTVTISKTPTGKYFASILVETPFERIPPKQINPETVIGIDVGIKSFIVTSNNKVFEPNRKLKISLKRLKCLQRRASRKKKGSNNYKKANLCVAILHEKITNQRTDYIHKVTTGLIRDNQAETFVIEDLNVVGMLKNRKLSQAISDVSFGEFFRQLKYKCDWYGKNLIVIGRFEPSSKTCSECGVINETLTLDNREWPCANCGTIHDRDLNAARNIRNMGLNNTRRGTPEEPVELPTLVGAKKQECVFADHRVNTNANL